MQEELIKTVSAKKQKWWEWHKQNPHVYQLFKRFTYDALNAGKKHSSAWLIVNRIRWETSIVTRGSDFKISNDFIAYYARLFHAEHPQHEGFFRTKRMKDDP